MRSAATDIGTGTYTIATQLAAELLGLDIRQVRVEIGDSDLPSARVLAARGWLGRWVARSRMPRPTCCAPSIHLAAVDVNAISELVPEDSRGSDIGENVDR